MTQRREMSSLLITREALLTQPGFIASIGSPGAGKSTFFDNLLAPTSPEDTANEWLRLERDRYRIALFGTQRSFWNHPLDAKIKAGVIRRSMRGALMCWPYPKWCLTDTGYEKDSITYFLARANMHYRDYRASLSKGRATLAPMKRIPVCLIVFEQTLEVLIERNRTRPEADRVDEQILIDRYDGFYGPDAWWRELEQRDANTSRVLVYRPEQIVD